MCRAGGRRCPSSRSGRTGGGQPADKSNISAWVEGLAAQDAADGVRASAPDISTPAGRAAVIRAQRASEDAWNPSPAEAARNADIMFGRPR